MPYDFHGAAIRHPDEPAGPAGGRPRVLFQLVPEPKTVKNRLHLDIRVGAENIGSQVAALTARWRDISAQGNPGPALVGDDGRPGGQ